MSYGPLAVRIVCGGFALFFAASVVLAAPLELQNRQPEQGQSGQAGEPGVQQPDQPRQPEAPAAQPAPQPGSSGGQQGVQQPTAPTVIVPVTPPPSEPQAPTVIVPVVPVPVTPQPPKAEPVPETRQPDVVIVPVTPDPEKPKEPEQAKPEEPKVEPLTPGSFLPKTEEPKAEVKPEKKEPAKQPEKKAEPKKEPEKKQPEKPEKKPEKQADPAKPKKGDPLKIPDDAKATGSLDFLEGCWVGTRPEYHTKRIVTERFCFGKDGVGKRFILDPGVAGQCVGATKAILNQGGVLRMESDRMYCTDVDDNWGASQMTCQGEGDQTPCSWVFHDVGGAKQSYTIRFVRE